MGFFDLFRRKKEGGMDLSQYFQIAIKQDILGSRIDEVQKWFDEIDRIIKQYEDYEDIPLNLFLLPPNEKRRIINKGVKMLYSAAIPWLRIYDNGEFIEVVESFLQNLMDTYKNDNLLDLILEEILLILAKSFSNKDVEPLPPLVIYMPYMESPPAVPTRERGLEEISQRLKGYQTVKVESHE